MLSFSESVRLFYKRAFDFGGRSSRSEYWWCCLFNFIISLVPFVNIIAIINLVPSIAQTARRLHDTGRSALINLLVVPACIIALIVLGGILACTSQSMNGYTNDNGYILAGLGSLAFLPYCIYLLACTLMPSAQGANRYGAMPSVFVEIEAIRSGLEQALAFANSSAMMARAEGAEEDYHNFRRFSEVISAVTVRFQLMEKTQDASIRSQMLDDLYSDILALQSESGAHSQKRAYGTLNTYFYNLLQNISKIGTM